MTRLPNSKLVARLQRQVNRGFFVDTAVLIAYTISSYDSYGHPVRTASETEVACSFTDKPNPEEWKEYDIEKIDAEIRYTGAKASKGYRFRLVHRFDRDTHQGQKFTSQEFEVLDIRDRDVFGYVVALREVQV